MHGCGNHFSEIHAYTHTHLFRADNSSDWLKVPPLLHVVQKLKETPSVRKTMNILIFIHRLATSIEPNNNSSDSLSPRFKKNKMLMWLKINSPPESSLNAAE